MAAMAAIASAALSAAAAAAAAVAPSRLATRVPGCLPDGSGYLRARIRGAVSLDIDWHNAELECEGGVRPAGHGIRVAFAGPVRPTGRRLRMIFGIGAVGAGRAGRELPTNVTVIFEGERRLYSTESEDKCTVDRLTQQRLGRRGGAILYRVVARGFCFEPLTGMIRAGRIVLSRFDFAGRIAYAAASP
jgi:hypothetical protein